MHPVAPPPPAEEAHARWEQLRAGGRTQFIIRRGVLSWGVPVAIVTIFYKVIQEQGFVWSPHLTASLRTAIALAFVVFPICGWIFGGMLWETQEARYRKRERYMTDKPTL